MVEGGGWEGGKTMVGKTKAEHVKHAKLGGAGGIHPQEIF